jgi:hypothetical protein
MPKIRDSGSKPDIFEAVTTQTRRGKKITHVAVSDSQPSPAPSRTASPSKKRALSPGVPDFNNDYEDFSTDQLPKRSRTSGKVGIHIHGVSDRLNECLQTQNEFLQEYLDRRHSILIELLRHEALPSISSCSLCHQSSATHRCRDCFGHNLWCGPCCISTHKSLPFHRVQTWNGRFFEQSDILERGLTLDLHHYPDDCPSIQSNTESDLTFDLDPSDESDEFIDNNQPSLDNNQPSLDLNDRSRSVLTIVSSTGIFKHSI